MPRRTHTAGRMVAGLAVGALVAALASVVGGTAASAGRLAGAVGSASPAHPTSGPTGSVRVTLITGDVVTVTQLADGRSVTTVDPESAAEGTIRSATVGDHTYVYPEAALPYLASGRLDQQLFDVTSLIDQGYDDASAPRLPLIVEYTKQSGNTKTISPPRGTTRTATLASIRGAALSASRTRASAFWSAITPASVDPAAPRFDEGIAHIYLDARVGADLADSVAQVGAPQAWSAGYDGTGVTVAVLDSGVDASHPDLADHIVDKVSFVPDENTDDYVGHGTHVASTIAGTGAASSGVEKGVAPGANLLIGKVLGNDGFGQESWIIDGMEWASAHAPIVNMSLGSDQPSDGTDPMSQAVDTLSQDNGTLFVVAAGNMGAPMIGAPGAADDALTVGAVDSADQLTWFSSTGPRTGDLALKPDLVAPGQDILAARSAFSTEGSGYYTTMSGTSMATPHVAGAAAILAEQHPAWSGQQLKDTLMSTAFGLDTFTPYQVGTGRLDVERAITTVHATGSAYFGFYPWPHDGDAAATRTITYTNSGDDAVTLDLALTANDQDANPAPADSITMSADQVTVAAHDTASVTVTGDPTTVPAGTTLAGVVVASAAGSPVARTTVGLASEAERYDLTIDATGRDGQPALAYALLHGVDDPWPTPVTVDGSATLRLPPGTYSVTSFMDTTDGPDSPGIALLGNPQLVLGADTTLHLDARDANPITVTAPQADAAPVWRRMEWSASAGTGFSDMIMVPTIVDNLYAAPTEEVADGTYTAMTRWRLRAPVMSVNVGSRLLDVTPMIFGGDVRARTRSTAVDAGTGSVADFQGIDASGKVVVVRRSDTVTIHRAAVRARRLGAVAVVVANNQPGEFVDIASGPNGAKLAIPVAAISGVEGDWLLGRLHSGDPVVTVDGGMNSPYVDDLVDLHNGHIPTDLAYAPTRADLARIDTRYQGVGRQLGGEFRYEFLPYSERGWGVSQYTRFPSSRTEWVSAEPGTKWYQEAQVLEGTWDARGDIVDYRPGQRTSQDWFGPVVAPRLGPGYWLPARQGNYLNINLPSFADSGANHTGGMDGFYANQRIKLYHGKTLLQASKGWQAIYTDEMSPKLRTYRITNDVSRDARTWGTSTRSHTEWTFRSKASSNPNVWQMVLPFIQVGFDVGTDLAGDTAAGRHDTIGFTAWQLADAVGGGAITGGRLQVSYDGGSTWRPVPLAGRPGHWRATLAYPDHPSAYVSLRATAWDAKGNRVTQTVIRAYGLR